MKKSGSNNNVKPRFAFYVMSAKGLAVLKHHVTKFGTKHIAGVVTSPDPQVKNDFFNEIKVFCKKEKIPCFSRKGKKAPAADFTFVISWKWMILDAKNVIILHDALLPRYRGFAPLVNMLVNGEKRIGVSALFAGASYDTGNILGQRSISISYPLKINIAIGMIVPLYCKLVEELSVRILSGEKLVGKAQDQRLASYSLWRDEEDYRIDWNKSANDIRRFVDAVGFPYKGASCIVGEKLIRVMSCEVMKDVKVENRDAGKVLFMEEDGPIVVCGRGLLKLTEMREENGNQFRLHKFRIRFR